MALLEVNDFNAVRISLASPEQVRSWSYGEVTKPETINYRTLKPEKDGLFCEKIFGPTKDFECYCGKYKRVRYKGIVCDKCGVEVARSKVRRERMGHIELASPVAHIWFVKGTPSRIGLLLDISPRSLERVLYFAQYLITHVDEAAKKRALDHLKEEMDKESARRVKDLDDMLISIESTRDEAVSGLKERRDAELGALEEERLQSADALMKAAVEIEKKLTAASGTLQRRGTQFEGVPVVPAGEVVTEAHVEALKSAVQARVAAQEEEFTRRRSDIELVANAAIEEKLKTAASEADPLRKKIEEEKTAVRTQFQEDFKELESLKDPATHDLMRLLTDSDYKRLGDKFGSVFNASMGADAVLSILQRIDLEKLRAKLQIEMQSTSGQKRKKATKRLRVVEALRKSGNKPTWMVLGVLPVLPPDLRPMVQLDGGRFATSDLNDLYRRVINRNNRLKRLLELGAPEIIIRNEKRMLQEAVDSLIDNGRRGRAVSGTGNHKLKSLSDMLKGKQGRFRQNLLGKRVDYSGRSVIVVGPELKLHQCGLPKRMALELFKPFVMHGLVERGLAHNIKSAKRIVERARPEVWDVLDEVVSTRPVLLNRAPTLHRLGIQAFEPVLVDGSAIQIHPLVCAAFNADFDGDQMAVHVPLAREAVAEARQIMLSTKNLLSPSSGDPMVAPRLDIVLGCYYMTALRPGAKGELKERSNGTPPQGIYGSFQEAILAYDLGIVELQAKIRARDARTDGKLIETSVGRIIFNEALPDEIEFRNETMDSKALKKVVQDCYKQLGMDSTSEVVDQIKNIGFRYATKSGVTISVSDIKVPVEKKAILAEAEKRVHEISDQFQMGLITEQERYDAAVDVWNGATEKVTEVIQKRLPEYGSVFLMATSGAKGNIAQIRQMAGMRGLTVDPSGRIIDLPIRSNFREGLSVLEYFISTHGARKGLADTALRTADSGYLTRRLIDVAQDVITLEEDCGTISGVWLGEPSDKGVLESLRERIIGRYAASPMANPETGEIIVDRDEEIDAEKADTLMAAGFGKVHVRSPLTCGARRGICSLCYGRSLATGELARLKEAVGIVAAQSIGEPGTQLTMRTFHTGGVYMAGGEITSGLPRVTELFEARVPKNAAIISEIDGIVEIVRDGESRRVKIISTELYSDRYDLPENAELLVSEGQHVESGAVLARSGGEGSADLPAAQVVARLPGRVTVDRSNRVSILYEERDEREYVVPATGRVRVEPSEYIRAGQQLTDGPLDPQKILQVLGPEAVALYLVEEVQKVYRAQGVNINDKHIEVIVRQMMRKVVIDSPGDTTMLPGEYADRFQYEEANAKVFAEGGEPATAMPVLLGITKASLNTASFLAAASFQETTRVLTEAAISGKTDHLLGLKENVIIGKLIPAQAPITVPPRLVEDVRLPRRLLEEGEEGEEYEIEDLEEEVDGDDLEGEEVEVGVEDAGERPRAVSAYVAEPDVVSEEDDV